MQGGTAVCSMGANGRHFFLESRKLQIRFRVRERVTLMIWLCSSHLTLRESCADRVVDITNRLKHESLEDRMYSQFARSRHSGGSTPACQKMGSRSFFPRCTQSCALSKATVIFDKNWVHHTGNSEEVQSHVWGISSYRAQGFCLKGDLPQHQAAITACSVGWHSLPWSCHVARIE